VFKRTESSPRGKTRVKKNNKKINKWKSCHSGLCNTVYIFHTLRSFREKQFLERKIQQKKNTSWNLIRLHYCCLLLFSEEEITRFLAAYSLDNSFLTFFPWHARFRTGPCVGLSPDPEVNLIRSWGRGLCVMAKSNNWIFDLRAAWKTNCMSLSSSLLLFASYGTDRPHSSQRVVKKQKLVV